MTTVVCPGTFDPITMGHESLIRRAADIFDQVVVAVASGVHKEAFFTLDERVALAAEAFAAAANIRAAPCEGLLADFLRENNCRIILRGMRAVSDFEFETQLAGINKKLDPSVETLLMMPDREFIYTSSSLVREIALLGGALEKFVSPHVAFALREKIKKGGG